MEGALTGGRPPSPLLVIVVITLISTCHLIRETCAALAGAFTSDGSLHDFYDWSSVIILGWALWVALFNSHFRGRTVDRIRRTVETGIENSGCGLTNFPLNFCSWSNWLLYLLILGRKLLGSLLNVTSRFFRNLLHPVNRLSGVLALASTEGWPSKTMTRSARYWIDSELACLF